MNERGRTQHAACALGALAGWRVKRDPDISSLTLALPTMSNNVAQINFGARSVVDVLRDFMSSEGGIAEHQQVPIIDTPKVLGLMPFIKYRRSLFSGARIKMIGQPVPQPGGGPPAQHPYNTIQLFKGAHCTAMGSRTSEGPALVGHLFRLHHNELLPDRQIVMREIRSTNCVMSCSLPFEIDMDKLAARNGMTSVQQYDSFPGVMLEHHDSPEAAEQAWEEEERGRAARLHAQYEIAEGPGAVSVRDRAGGPALMAEGRGSAGAPASAPGYSAQNIANLSCLVFSSGEVILTGLVDYQKDTIHAWFKARLSKWAACRAQTGASGKNKLEAIREVRAWLIRQVEEGRADFDVAKIRSAHYLQVISMWTQLRRRQRSK